MSDIEQTCFDAESTEDTNAYIDSLMDSIKLDDDYWRIRFVGEGLDHSSSDLVDPEETKDAITGVVNKNSLITKAIDDLTQGLSEQQKRAVTSTAKQLAITAIPGAGKTKTALVIEKIRAIRLSESGKPTNTEQSKILSLTFGREATLNASFRSNSEIGDWFMPGIQHKTIHSLAKEICDTYGSNPPLLCDPSSPKSYSDADMMEHAPEDVSPDAKIDYEDRYRRAKAVSAHVAKKLLELAGEAKKKYKEQGSTRSIIKNALKAELGKDSEDRLTEAEKYVWDGYLKEMEANDAVDYGLLVLNATKYLEEVYKDIKKQWKRNKGKNLARKYFVHNVPNDEAKKRLREDFRAFVDSKLEGNKWIPDIKCLILDEAQDVNQAQIGLLEALVKLRDPDYVVIGDPHQAIYRFQGSDSSYIEDVGLPTGKKKTEREGSYERDGETIHLTLNYRSTKEILDTANGLFYKKQDDKMEAAPVLVDGKEIVPSDTCTQGYSAYNHWDENRWVYTQIRELIQSGTWTSYEDGRAIQHKYLPEDIVILARQWGRLDEFVRDCGYKNRKECTQRCANLSTVHSAKGKQWKAVFVIGLSQQTWRQDELLDAKCLLHVALTRAERRLFLSWASVETINNQQVSVNKLRLLTSLCNVDWESYTPEDQNRRGIERDEVDEIKDIFNALAAESESETLSKIRFSKLQNLDLARISAVYAKQCRSEIKQLENTINDTNEEDRPALQTKIAEKRMEMNKFTKMASDLIDCAKGEFITVSYDENDPELRNALLSAKTVSDLPDCITAKIVANDSKESVCGQRVCNKSNEVRAKRMQIQLGSIVKYAFDENALKVREGLLTPADTLANPVFMTMTSPNVPADKIRDEIEIYKKAIRQMQRAGRDEEKFDPTGNYLKGEVKQKEVSQWKTEFWRKAVRGTFYSIEIVPNHRDNGTNDYHVHAHMLLLTTRQYYWEEHKTPRGQKKSFLSRFFLPDGKQSTFRAWHDWWTRCYFWARADYYRYGYRCGFIENPLDPEELAYAEKHGYSIPGVYKDENGEWVKKIDESGENGTDVTGLLFTDVRATYNKNSKYRRGGYSKEGIQYAVFETAKYITKFLNLVPTPERIEHEDGSVTYEQKLDDETLVGLVVPFVKAIDGVNTFSRFQTINDTYKRAKKTEKWLNGDETVAGITYQQYLDYCSNPEYGLIGIDTDYVSKLCDEAKKLKGRMNKLKGRARKQAEREYKNALFDWQTASDTAKDLTLVYRDALDAYENGNRAFPTKDNLDVDDPKALIGTDDVLEALKSELLPNLSFDNDLPDDCIDETGFLSDHPTNPSFLTLDWLADQYLANDKNMKVITKHKFLWNMPAYRYINVSTEGGDDSEEAMKKIKELNAKNQDATDKLLGNEKTADTLGFTDDDDDFDSTPESTVSYDTLGFDEFDDDEDIF